MQMQSTKTCVGCTSTFASLDYGLNANVEGVVKRLGICDVCRRKLRLAQRLNMELFEISRSEADRDEAFVQL